MAGTLNFELEFEANDDGSYVVTAQSDGEPSATATFALPYSQAQLERVISDMGRTRTVRRREDPAEAMARSFGRRLFETVITGDVLEALRSSLTDAERNDATLRLRLNFKKALKLTDLPWEFLYAPERQDYLALSANTLLVRSIDIPYEYRRALTVAPPLTLGLLISSPREYEKLDVDRELANIYQALEKLEAAGSLVVRRIEPTRQGLLNALNNMKLNILHFIGHGEFDEATGDGTLMLETDTKRADTLFGTELGQMVSGRAELRMVVLNSCVGARSTAIDPFAGVANALLLRNIPAVVAMQFEITDRAAVTFAERFYTAIASGVPVDVAIGRARQTLRLVERNLVEWATPVLYLQTDDAQIFGSAPQTTKPDASAYPGRELEQMWNEGEVSALTSRIRDRLKEGDLDGAESDYQAASHELRQHPDMVAIEGELKEYRRARSTMRTARYLADAGQWRDVLDRVRSITDAGIVLAGLDELGCRAEAEVEKQEVEAELRSAMATAEAAAASNDWEKVLDVLEPLAAIDAKLDPGALTDARELMATATVRLQLAAIGGRMRDAHGHGLWRAVVDAYEELETLDVDHPDDLDTLAVNAKQELAAGALQERLDAEYEAALTLMQNERWSEARAMLDSIDDASTDYRGVHRLMATADRNIELGAAVDEAVDAATAREWARVLLGLARFVEERETYGSLARFGEADELHRRAVEEVGAESAHRAAELQHALEKGRSARAVGDWGEVASALQPVAGIAAYEEFEDYDEAVALHAVSEVMQRIGDAGGEGSDDLTDISGVGRATAKQLRQLGIVRLAQIAALTPEDLSTIADALGSHVTVERIDTEDWIGQADRLVHGPAPSLQPRLRFVKPTGQLGKGFKINEQARSEAPAQKRDRYLTTRSDIGPIDGTYRAERKGVRTWMLAAVVLVGAVALFVAFQRVFSSGGEVVDDEVAVLEGHTGAVDSVAWSPDGTQLATGSTDDTARIWDIDTGQTATELRGHTGAVWSAAWSPDGTQLATGSWDQTARIWDIDTGQTATALEGHSGEVWSVAWSPDGKQLATGSTDDTARIWDIDTGQTATELQGHAWAVWSVAWSPDGTQLATGSRDITARIWDIDTGRAMAVLEGHTSHVWSVAWSPDGTRLATVSRDRTAMVWPLERSALNEPS